MSRHVFLFEQKTCLFVGQENMSPWSPSSHVFLFEQDMPSHSTRRNAFLLDDTTCPLIEHTQEKHSMRAFVWRAFRSLVGWRKPFGSKLLPLCMAEFDRRISNRLCFPDWYFSGGQNHPKTSRSILHPSRELQQPYMANHMLLFSIIPFENSFEVCLNVGRKTYDGVV